MAGKINPIKDYQDAANQLLAINEQQKSNNAQAKMEETIQAAQNNTLAQASEFVATQPRNEQVVNADFNPATKNILGQYGLGQPKIQKTSSSSQQVTKQNIVINNKNTTITNNNVSIPSNSGGPVQGRPIQFQDPGQIKFKTWLSNSFAQQNEMAAKRQREYEKRDSALVRSSNKLMKKLEDMGKTISTTLNPKNMASNMTNQLRTLFMVFGFAAIAKNWPTLMERVDKISSFFSKGGSLVKMFGGKDNETVFQAFKNLFIGKEGILSYIGTWLKHRFEERGAAIKTIPKPKADKYTGGLNADNLINHLSKVFSGITDYLGNILGVLVDPSFKNVVEKSATYENNLESEEKNTVSSKPAGERETYVDVDGNKIKATRHASYYLEGIGSSGLAEDALDKEGNLKNDLGAELSQGNSIASSILAANHGEINTNSISTGLDRLIKLIESKGDSGSIYLPPNLVSQLNYILPEEELSKISEGKYPGIEYKKLFYITRPNKLWEKDIINKHEEVAFIEGDVNYENAEDIKPYLKKNQKLIQDQRTGKPKYSRVLKVNKEGLDRIIKLMYGDNIDTKNITSDDSKNLIKDKLLDQYNLSIKYGYNRGGLHEYENLINEHEQQESQRWNNSRLKSGLAYTNNKTNNLYDRVSNMASNLYDRVSGVIPIKDIKKVNPSDINSGDLSGVVEASKRGVFYSSSSGGYIPLGKDLKGFMHKCTSGPATFYKDGSGGKIDLNGKWWNTGSPKTATGTNIDKEGFKLVWNGTHEQGWDTNSIKATGFELQPGDIMLNFGRTKNGSSSHAQMWNGEEWISDTHQGQRSFVYRGGGRLGDKSAQIWRYDAGIEKQNISLASAETEQDGLLDSSDVEAGIVNFDSNEMAYNTIPTITPNNSDEHLPYPFLFYNPTSGSNYIPSLEATFTPESNISSTYPSAFSGNTKGSNDFTNVQSDISNYTPSFDRVNKNLETIQGLLQLDLNANANTLEATNNVIAAIGSLREKNTNNIPFASSFTDGHYNPQS